VDEDSVRVTFLTQDKPGLYAKNLMADASALPNKDGYPRQKLFARLMKPVLMVTDRTPRVAYFSRVEMPRAKRRLARIGTAMVIAAGSVMNDPGKGTVASTMKQKPMLPGDGDGEQDRANQLDVGRPLSLSPVMPRPVGISGSFS